jgi:hypothetical protein
LPLDAPQVIQKMLVSNLHRQRQARTLDGRVPGAEPPDKRRVTVAAVPAVFDRCQVLLSEPPRRPPQVGQKFLIVNRHAVPTEADSAQGRALGLRGRRRAGRRPPPLGLRRPPRHVLVRSAFHPQASHHSHAGPILPPQFQTSINPSSASL